MVCTGSTYGGCNKGKSKYGDCHRCKETPGYVSCESLSSTEEWTSGPLDEKRYNAYKGALEEMITRFFNSDLPATGQAQSRITVYKSPYFVAQLGSWNSKETKSYQVFQTGKFCLMSTKDPVGCRAFFYPSSEEVPLWETDSGLCYVKQIMAGAPTQLAEKVAILLTKGDQLDTELVATKQSQHSFETRQAQLEKDTKANIQTYVELQKEIATKAKTDSLALEEKRRPMFAAVQEQRTKLEQTDKGKLQRELAAANKNLTELAELKKRVKNGAYISWTTAGGTVKRALIKRGDTVEALGANSTWSHKIEYVKGDKGTIKALRFKDTGELDDFTIDWEGKTQNRSEKVKNNRVRPDGVSAMSIPRAAPRRLRETQLSDSEFRAAFEAHGEM